MRHVAPEPVEDTLGRDKKDEAFRVIDRRLFDESGALRQEVVQHERDEAATQKPAPAASPAAPAAPKDAPAPSRTFQMLVDLLYSNAAVYLGGYADPATGRPVLDLEGARNIIDILEMLREKTRGALAPEDDRMLVEAMGSLKMAFLEVSKAADQALRQKPAAANPTALRSKP